VTISIGINGFGRIGDPRTFAHLLKYDRAMGIFELSVQARADAIVVDGRPIRFLSIPEVRAQPWGDLGAEIVIESTGHLTDATRARAHMIGAARAKSSSRRRPRTRTRPSSWASTTAPTTPCGTT
jgi:glyceraldehyde 3-phosphate dehydrogenase